MRFGPGTETQIAGDGNPDPRSGTQTGYGPDLSITPEGLAIDTHGKLLFSSGHAVYQLNDPAQAAPWDGTACDPSVIYPGADLSGADLTGIDLRRCDLSGVILDGTNLTGAELSGADASGADLTSANFTGATGTPTGGSTATYSATTCPDATVATSPATCVGHGFAN